jgi:hypothetical protein
MPATTEYPKYRENIWLLAFYCGLSSATTKVGIAKPSPEPMMLDPTKMAVARALFDTIINTFYGKNQ